ADGVFAADPARRAVLPDPAVGVLVADRHARARLGLGQLPGPQPAPLPLARPGDAESLLQETDPDADDPTSRGPTAGRGGIGDDVDVRAGLVGSQIALDPDAGR